MSQASGAFQQSSHHDVSFSFGALVCICFVLLYSVGATEKELAAATGRREELYAKQSRGSKYRTAAERDAALKSQVTWMAQVKRTEIVYVVFCVLLPLWTIWYSWFECWGRR